MRIGLFDTDSTNYPNLALMKISAWHKKQGNDVGWYSPFDERYDKVYVSKVFSFSEEYMEHINSNEIIYGGTGYAIKLINGKEVYDKSLDIQLPCEIEHTYPDYLLYPQYTNNTAFGFLTRGCPRGCDFCIVAKKEGQKSLKVANLDEFWRGQKNIILNDPNILACKEWKELLQQLIDSNAMIDFNQGLDIRLMTEEKALMFNNIKIKEIHFAWDRYEDKELILKNLKMYAQMRRIKPHSHNWIVYTIVNFNTSFEEDLDRIYTLRDIGYWAYVMIYDKQHCAHEYIDLQRWVNNRFIFAKCEKFEDYMQHY